MITKHAPGPWIVVQETGVKTLNHVIHCENAKQAQLIASAPELLEAVATIYSLANLQTLLETKYSKALVNDLMKQMQIALDKARGES